MVGAESLLGNLVWFFSLNEGFLLDVSLDSAGFLSFWFLLLGHVDAAALAGRMWD